jgi:hypothetical protein
MKDARGHGSNPRGGGGYFAPTQAAAHQAGVEKIFNKFNAGKHVNLRKYSAAMTAIGYQNWKQEFDRVNRMKL